MKIYVIVMDGVLIFEGTHQVMGAEKIIQGEGLSMRLIPVPRALTSDCGLAIRIDDMDRFDIFRVLNKSGYCPKEYYIRDGRNYIRQDMPSG